MSGDDSISEGVRRISATQQCRPVIAHLPKDSDQLSNCSTAATSDSGGTVSSDDSDNTVHANWGSAPLQPTVHMKDTCHRPCLPHQVPPARQEQAVLIYDWDDTLLPTTFLRNVVLPQTYDKKTGCPGPVPKSSDLYKVLARHACVVRDVLTASRKVGRVAIVTLSKRPWIYDSAERYLPGLNMPELLKELDIPVYYASEHCNGGDMNAEYFTMCKQKAMFTCLSKIYLEEDLDCDVNALSIGDAAIEQEAIKELLSDWDPTPVVDHGPLCKTVRLQEQPSLQQLSDELQLLMELLPTMVRHSESFDFYMEESIGLRNTEHKAGWAQLKSCKDRFQLFSRHLAGRSALSM
eukprot:gnl/TRDRNA2_/TRDRNA2_167863_c1_seq2.p1 gnl/TRDRNA2_/TRDRNA2_167863_c1~~gnl/TRDRNA2_/TRDRNA2_167863_c1_seq2.p1  ORF type:complete len:398 (+),score=59.63 gnl/TRDRNA2_/TRDRNA2_167863_c1_seq2:145-1194(+)